jgi:uncharacterized integral membrane protein (TIGR00697 family)
MTQRAGRELKYYDLVASAFVIVLVVSTTAGGPKVTTIAGLTVGAGIVFYPFIYLLNDVLTEVYGYALARRAVWTGLAGLIFAALVTGTITAMPPAPDWHDQQAYETVFGLAPRIVLASLIAFVAGEFVNAFVLAKLKVATNGAWLGARTIGSSVAGVAVDSLLFYPLAFWGVWEPGLLVTVMATEYAIKVGGEIVATPFTYAVCGWLKRQEGVDAFDRATDFNPFSLKA